jgi:hypothetical protein
LSSRHTKCIRRGRRVCVAREWTANSRDQPEAVSFASDKARWTCTAGKSGSCPMGKGSGERRPLHLFPCYRHEVLDDVHVWKGINFHGFLGGFSVNFAETSERIPAFNVHGTRAANALTTAPTKGKSGVQFVFDLDKGVKDHWAAFVEVKCVSLEEGSFPGSFRVLKEQRREGRGKRRGREGECEWVVSKHKVAGNNVRIGKLKTTLAVP